MAPNFIKSAMNVLKLPEGRISIWRDGINSIDDCTKSMFIAQIQSNTDKYTAYEVYWNPKEELPLVADRGKKPTYGTRLEIGFKSK